jgi:hypothetical protein
MKIDRDGLDLAQACAPDYYTGSVVNSENMSEWAPCIVRNLRGQNLGRVC